MSEEFDKKRETLTLGEGETPEVTIMKGHVDAKAFDIAWKMEGYEGHLLLLKRDNPYHIEELQKTLYYSYGKKTEKGYEIHLQPEIFDAFPITVLPWQ